MFSVESGKGSMICQGLGLESGHLAVEIADMPRQLNGRAVTGPRVRRSLGGQVFRMAVYGLFLITLALSVYLVKWSIASIPVRGIFAISMLLLVAATNIEIIVSEIGRFTARPPRFSRQIPASTFKRSLTSSWAPALYVSAGLKEVSSPWS
jgi:hypothetical protein